MKILVVEDDRKVAGFIEQGLREEGYAVDVAKEGEEAPILMLTARDATEDVVRGLDAGADDYLSKPFKFDELLARMRALTRRGGAARLDRLTYGSLELDRLRHKARANSHLLDLTPREFQLLEHFMLHPEEVIRRTELLEKVWDMHFDPESNVVDVHVGNLRRKLKDAGCDGLIQTVRGVGFCLKTPETADA
jgi:DNA-binding response OmpR family regulator